MSKAKSYVFGGGEKVQEPAAAATATPLSEVQDFLSSNKESNAMDLDKAAELVNRTKALYDDCEARRMGAVMNGKDAQDYSCEREFTAFKQAFDIQLAAESRIIIQQQAGSAQQR